MNAHLFFSLSLDGYLFCFSPSRQEFPKSFSERGPTSRSLRWSKNSAERCTAEHRKHKHANYELLFRFIRHPACFLLLVHPKIIVINRMAVLASREHTCIHPEVSRSSNKNEGCKTLNDPRIMKQQKVSAFFFLSKLNFRRSVWSRVGSRLWKWKRWDWWLVSSLIAVQLSAPFLNGMRRRE